MRVYEQKQTKNRHLREDRLRYVYANVKGYRLLDESVATLSVSQGKKLLNGDPDALTVLKEQLRRLSQDKKALLRGAGLPDDYLEPVYETCEGWNQDVSGIREYSKLPENCKKYLAKLEKLIGAPISIVSVGPDRDQTIFKF